MLSKRRQKGGKKVIAQQGNETVMMTNQLSSKYKEDDGEQDKPEFERLVSGGHDWFKENDHRMGDVVVESVPWLSKLFSLFPLTWCGSCFVLEPREEAIVMHFGSLTDIKRKPGVHFVVPAGADVRKVSTKQRTCSLPDCKITDSRGNPIVCSAVLNYRVADGKRALLNVHNVDQFVRTNATAVLKQVVSRHTYDECKAEAAEMNDLMRTALQQRVSMGGVNVGSMEINELNYAPEIASGMLKKQQAMALIAARNVIVVRSCALSAFVSSPIAYVFSRHSHTGRFVTTRADKIHPHSVIVLSPPFPSTRRPRLARAQALRRLPKAPFKI